LPRPLEIRIIGTRVFFKEFSSTEKPASVNRRAHRFSSGRVQRWGVISAFSSRELDHAHRHCQRLAGLISGGSKDHVGRYQFPWVSHRIDLSRFDGGRIAIGTHVRCEQNGLISARGLGAIQSDICGFLKRTTAIVLAIREFL
jgi:hypothetical protein